MRKYVFIVSLLYYSSGCHTDKEAAAVDAKQVAKHVVPAVLVNLSDTGLKLVNGTWLYHGQAFSGTIRKLYPSGAVQYSQDYYQGKEDGNYFSFYANGAKEASRYYRNGEKDSVHTGWWPDGKLRYEYHFRTGVYEGDFKEWYAGGQPLKHIIYHNGKEQSGKGWRENGKPYMSFIMKDGRLYGLINPNLCYSLSNGKGEFRQSVP